LSFKLIAPLAAVLAVSACANTAPPVLSASDPRNDGIAKTCTPTNPDTSKPGPYTASIAMTSDGWCGVFASDGGKPFLLGLARQRPTNGRLEINRVENSTRAEYYPNPGFTGTDAFTVALRPSSGAADVPLAVAVNVAQGARPAVAPAAATGRPAASTVGRNTRRTTARRPSAAR